MILLIIAMFLFAACKSDYQSSSRSNKPLDGQAGPRQVKAILARKVKMEKVITATGTLAAYDQATISPKVPGRLRTFPVDIGSVVKKGQMIAQLEQEDYQLRLEQADAGLAQARARLGLDPKGTDDRVNLEETGTVRQARAVLEQSTLQRERTIDLYQKGVISKSQLDAAEADYKVALSKHQDAIEEIRNREALVVQRRSELNLARQQLEDTSIYASFDGVVQERRTAIGEYLAAGIPIVTIVKIDPLRMRVEIPEREAHDVRKGQLVRVMVEGDPDTYSGLIKRLSPSITAQNRILIIEAEVSNKGKLRPGSFAKAEIVTDSDTMALAVPVNSIVTFAGIDKVILIQNGKAVETPVTTGRSTPEQTEIISGINPGDQVVVDPGNLQTGQTVKVVE